MYNCQPKTVAELQHRLRQIDLTVGVMRALVNDIILPLGPKALQMLNRLEVVAVPILRPSTVELIDACKQDFDGFILVSILNELGLCYGLDIDLIETLDETQTVKYILLLALFEDLKPDDDDPDDDDDPTAKPDEPPLVLAMSAGAGKLR